MVQVLDTIAQFRIARRSLDGPLGFIPTMGYLHEGHLSLVEQAHRENQHVVVSIFVNPTQFGPNEDLSKYPRDAAHDLELLSSAGVDLVYMPTAAEMYPPGSQTVVEVSEISQGLEGERRPGHFRGVATVVAKLFNIVQPNRAYFGQKDAQQVAVVRRMVTDLNFPLDIIVVPTRRAADGLALSSRNVYLNEQQRAAAPVLYRALEAAHLLYRDGSRSGPALREVMRSVLNAEPLAVVDYVSAADAETLRELEGETDRPVLLSMAVRIGNTRLIDNLILEPPTEQR